MNKRTNNDERLPVLSHRKVHVKSKYEDPAFYAFIFACAQSPLIILTIILLLPSAIVGLLIYGLMSANDIVPDNQSYGVISWESGVVAPLILCMVCEAIMLTMVLASCCLKALKAINACCDTNNDEAEQNKLLEEGERSQLICCLK